MCCSLKGCTTNPATDELSFTLFMPIEKEIEIGRQEHPKIIKQFGGVYDDPDLNEFITKTGMKLAKNSELPQLKFTFTILNTPVVNAFALPGGYVYITRGLLALANNEAQVAAVLAHEIGHITARHAAQRYSQAVIADLGLRVLSNISKNNLLNRLSGIGTNLYLRSYSRKQELQSDNLGMRYLERSNYDSKGMVDFLKQLEKYNDLQKKISQNPVMWSWFSTHPKISKRIVESSVTKNKDKKGGIIKKVEYLRKIDGMLFGDDPSQGFIKNNKFIHPKLGFSFQVPRGLKVQNNPDSIIMTGVENIKIIFDSSVYGGSIENYLEKEWGNQIDLYQKQNIIISKMPAIIALGIIKTNAGIKKLRLVIIAYDQKILYQFIIISEKNSRFSKELEKVYLSFKKIGFDRKEERFPKIIKIIEVQKGDSQETLSNQMSVDQYKIDFFRVLNGIKKGQKLETGEKIKLIK